MNQQQPLYVKDPQGGFFVLKEVLGTGTFATVRRAEDKSNQSFAIKLLKEDAYIKRNGEQYIATELNVLEKLSKEPPHPNIVTFYRSLNQHAFLLEYCNGKNLEEHIIGLGVPMTETFAREIFCQLLSALSFLHHKNIIHRDIKPQNVIVHKQSNGSISYKLSDFGLAAFKPNGLFETSLGTDIFAAPEVHARKTYNLSADIYSLGCLLYHIFLGKDERDKLNQTRQFPFKYDPTHLSTLNRSTSLKALLSQMLEPEPNERISLSDLLKHPWVVEREVPVSVYPPTPSSSQKTLKLDNIINFRFIGLILGVEIDNYMILASYLGSKEILPIGEDSIYHPIYTIEHLYFIERPQVNTTDQKSLDTFFSFPHINLLINQSSSIETDYGKQIILASHQLRESLKVLTTLSETLSKGDFILKIFEILYEITISLLKQDTTEAIISNQNNFQDILKKYKEQFDKIRELKQLDEQGNEIKDKLFISLLPFEVKTFLEYKPASLLKQQENLKIELEQKFKSFKEIKSRITLSKTKINELYREYETERKHLEGVDIQESTFEAIIDPDRVKQLFEKICNNYTRYSEVNHNSFVQTHNDIKYLLAVYFDLVNAHKKQNESINETKLAIEISQIPTFYKLYKDEIKRRYLFTKKFKEICEQNSQEFHNIIKKELVCREIFETINPPKYFAPLKFDGPKELVNPLAQYLKEDENDLSEFVITGSSGANKTENENKQKKIELLTKNKEIQDLLEAFKTLKSLSNQQQVIRNPAQEQKERAKEAEMVALKEKNQYLASQIDFYKSQIEQTKRSSIAQNTVANNPEIERLRNENMRLHMSQENMNSQIQQKNQEVETLLAKINQLRQDLQKKNQETVDITQYSQNLDSEVTRLETLAQTKSDTKSNQEREISRLNQQISDLNKKIEQLKIQNTNNNNNNNINPNNLSDFESERSHLINEIGKRDIEISEFQRQINHLNDILKSNHNPNNQDHEVVKLRSKLVDKETKINNLKNEIANLEAILADFREEYKIN
eukprot:gene2803-3485_t